MLAENVSHQFLAIRFIK